MRVRLTSEWSIILCYPSLRRTWERNCLSWGSIVQQTARMALIENLSLGFLSHMDVDRGGDDGTVAQKVLDES